MFSKPITFAALLALASSAQAAPCASNSSTDGLSRTAKLRLADTALDRYALLSEDKDFMFDFSQETSAPALFADSKTFPALVGTGASLTALTVPGCAVSPLHFHPRAAELFYVVSGRFQVYTVLEAGAVDAEGKPRIVRNDLTNNTMTVFHQGSVHTQFNPECEPSFVVAAFGSEDIGTGVVRVPSPNKDDMTATFGEDFGFEVDACHKRCGIESDGNPFMF